MAGWNVSAVDGGLSRYQRLRPGPGHAAGEVVANQRARIYDALTNLVYEVGYERVTVRELARVAGVSTKTFYQHFANLEACFRATYDQIVQDAIRSASTAHADSSGGIRIRVRALLDALGAEPRAATLVLVTAPSAGLCRGSSPPDGNQALERFVGDVLAIDRRAVPELAAVARGAAAAIQQAARSMLIYDWRASRAHSTDEVANWFAAIRYPGAPSFVEGADPTVTCPPAPTAAPGDERHFLLAAVTRLSLRDGYGRLTIPAIRREAGVSRHTFDQHFATVADCFLTAIAARLCEAVGRAETQGRGAGTWEGAIVLAVATLSTEVVRNQALARLGLVDILAPGIQGLELRERLLKEWSLRLQRTAPSAVRPGCAAAEASVAGIMAIMATLATDDVRVGGESRRIQTTTAAASFVALAPLIGPRGAVEAIANASRAIAE